MNLRIALKPQEGYNKIFDVGEYGMRLTKFGLLKLAKGTWKKPRVRVLDAKRNLEPAPFRIDGDALVLRLAPHSVALVEW